MEQVQAIIDRLAARGCRGELKGDRFVVTGIPDWKTRRMVENNLRELMLVATARDVFGTPHAEPLARTEADIKGNRCNHCVHFNLYVCTRNGKPPSPKLLETGCNRFQFTHTYF